MTAMYYVQLYSHFRGLDISMHMEVRACSHEGAAAQFLVPPYRECINPERIRAKVYSIERVNGSPTPNIKHFE